MRASREHGRWWLVKLRLLLVLGALAIGLVAAPLSASPPTVPLVDELGDHAEPDRALVLRAKRPRRAGPSRTSSTRTWPSGATWSSRATTTASGSSTSRAPKKPKRSSTTRSARRRTRPAPFPGTRATSPSTATSSAARGTRTRGRSERPVTATSCRRGSRACTSSTSRTRQDPDLIASVDLACGSHTQTMIPDLANNRLIVYVRELERGVPRNFDIVEIPLANPAGAHLLRPSRPRSIRATTSASSSGAR